MHGQGSYVWPDGRKYEGEYRNDKKNGYGLYVWADGRRYQGWWHNRKQFGLGVYVAKNGTATLACDPVEIKHGLWENGRRIKWFSKEEVRAIESGDTGFLETLSNPRSAAIVQHRYGFHPPPHFRYGKSLVR